MALVVILNKPYGVLCQFTDPVGRPTLKDYLAIRDVYAAGRLDFDSEGLVVLTNDGRLQARISQPRYGLRKHYWAQVEGQMTSEALQQLRAGVVLKDGKATALNAQNIDAPLGERIPPVPRRNNSWVDIVVDEGRNRMVRRMLAAVGFPVLRLVRHRLGNWQITNLAPGEYRTEQLHLPEPKPRGPSRQR